MRGEYENGAPPPLEGTGEISAIEAFSNKTMLLLGGTGFVGKVLLAMVLDRFPELKHLVVQVRRKKNVGGEQRFFNDVLKSPPLQPIVERLGGERDVRQKVSVVEGDLDEPYCGISADQIAALKGSVDIVVNLAGLVEFDPVSREAAALSELKEQVLKPADPQNPTYRNAPDVLRAILGIEQDLKGRPARRLAYAAAPLAR